MNKAKDRKNALDTLFSGGGMAGMVADATAPRPRLSSGAIGAAEINLIKDERDRLREELKTLNTQMASSVNVVELDPEQVQPSFVADRMEVAFDPAFEALKESIAETGQQVPILVRPAPGESGVYQIAYGHRRWKACRALGKPVRGVIKELSDEELLVAQGQENHERKDLSFIETCLFVYRLAQDYPQTLIVKAIGKDKSLVSKLRKLAATMPEEFLRVIGPAPKIGRPRWEEMASFFEDGRLASNHEKAVTSLFALDSFTELHSDERFSEVLQLLQETPAETEASSAQTAGEIPVAAHTRKANSSEWLGNKHVLVKHTGKATVFSVDSKTQSDFSAFLLKELPGLIAKYEETKGEDA
ncbi:chromosome partitioning protein, ParB family [Pseudovibrio denitrificans]|uniref:Chromosome partitioning protein, ParB family n=1 Tax=Pseudovibrio denitrificans TaxID=258256 RepID=A0A1I7DBJ4_9HYPH|nr:plasmid partitioning protein RepB [Pseudovibrio denitrificans]SFU08976.1 chromosome partitioning protein, ParB family [Pseudovibrio denitrificans]